MQTFPASLHVLLCLCPAEGSDAHPERRADHSSLSSCHTGTSPSPEPRPRASKAALKFQRATWKAVGRSECESTLFLLQSLLALSKALTNHKEWLAKELSRVPGQEAHLPNEMLCKQQEKPASRLPEIPEAQCWAEPPDIPPWSQAVSLAQLHGIPVLRFSIRSCTSPKPGWSPSAFSTHRVSTTCFCSYQRISKSHTRWTEGMPGSFWH